MHDQSWCSDATDRAHRRQALPQVQVRLRHRMRDEGRIGAMAICTKDRPALLVRGLRSYIANARRHGRSLEYSVYDDSETEAGRAATLAALSGLAKSEGVEI